MCVSAYEGRRMFIPVVIIDYFFFLFTRRLRNRRREWALSHENRWNGSQDIESLRIHAHTHIHAHHPHTHAHIYPYIIIDVSKFEWLSPPRAPSLPPRAHAPPSAPSSSAPQNNGKIWLFIRVLRRPAPLFSAPRSPSHPLKIT